MTSNAATPHTTQTAIPLMTHPATPQTTHAACFRPFRPSSHPNFAFIHFFITADLSPGASLSPGRVSFRISLGIQVSASDVLPTHTGDWMFAVLVHLNGDNEFLQKCSNP